MESLAVFGGGLSVSGGGLSVSSGGLFVSGGGLSGSSGALSVFSGGLSNFGGPQTKKGMKLSPEQTAESLQFNTKTHIQDSLFDGFASRRRRRRCYKAHSTGRRFVRSAIRRSSKMFTKHIHSGQSSPPTFEVRTLDI